PFLTNRFCNTQLVMKKDGLVADEPELASADVPADPTDDLDLEAMGLEDVELTEEERVAQVAAQARPVRKAATSEVAGKGHATPKRRSATGTAGDEHKRATPMQFARESVAELKKVVWPTLDQLQQYFVVVLVFVLIMIAIVSVLDLVFGAAILKMFG
ncbi:MAG: preprotein translocase subunit SecE, partial [Propionicimonas sp.]